jgi:mannose-6-phosphate isomerase-like protein (cupin superfamily)
MPRVWQTPDPTGQISLKPRFNSMPLTRAFDRCNLGSLPLENVQAHGGEGLIRFVRVADRSALLGGCNFIDLAELPPGTSIGTHTHRSSEEELYLVLEGSGHMVRNGEAFDVAAGDLIRNPPGGTHSLRNTGAGPLRIFVFELEVDG